MPENVPDVLEFLRDDPDFLLDQLSLLSGVHYEDRFQWFIALAIACLVIEAVIPDGRRRRKK